MADEHVIKVQFEGDGGNPQRQLEAPGVAEDRSAQQRREREEDTRTAFEDAQRRNEQRENERVRREHEDFEQSRRERQEHDRFEREQEDRDPENIISSRITSGSDETLNPPDLPPLHQPDGSEEPEWKTPPSTSREMVVYDPANNPRYSAGEDFTAEEWHNARDAKVVNGPPSLSPGEGGAGGGGSWPPVDTSVAAGGAPEEGAGGIAAVSEAILAIAEPAAIVVASIAGMAVAVFGVTEALEFLHDAMLSEFEPLTPQIAAARAQQEVELIQQRISTGQDIGPGAADTIEAQTGVEKELIEIKGHIISMIETLLKPLLYVVRTGLHIINWIWNHLPAALGGRGPVAGGAKKFQQDAEEFLNNLPDYVGARNQSRWGRRHPRNRQQP